MLLSVAAVHLVMMVSIIVQLHLSVFVYRLISLKHVLRGQTVNILGTARP